MTLYSCYNASDVRNELHGVFFFFFFPQMFHKVKITAKKKYNVSYFNRFSSNVNVEKLLW